MIKAVSIAKCKVTLFTQTSVLFVSKHTFDLSILDVWTTETAYFRHLGPMFIKKNR